MITFNRITAALALALTMTLAAAVAQASTFGFESVEGVLPGTISLDVAGTGSTALLTFSNSDTLGSSLANIYFDFGTDNAAFGSVSLIAASTGVDFTDNSGNLIPSSPTEMPGASTVGFTSLYSIQADSKGGKTHNGVNGGEYLTLALNLNSGYDVNWLETALFSGDVRMGIHALSIGENELSASGIAKTPIPGAVWLLGSGLFGLIGIRRRGRNA